MDLGWTASKSSSLGNCNTSWEDFSGIKHGGSNDALVIDQAGHDEPEHGFAQSSTYDIRENGVHDLQCTGNEGLMRI